MPELAQQILLFGVLLPGAVVVAVIGATRPWRAPPSDRPDGLGLGFALGPAIGVAYLAGEWGLFGRPELTPLSAPRWLVHAAVIGAIAGLLDAAVRDPRVRWAYVARAALAALPAWLLLRLGVHLWSGAAYAAWIALASAALLAGWLALTYALAGDADPPETAAPGLHPGVAAAALAMWAGGAAACVGLSGSVVIAERAGIVASALGAIAVAGFAFPRALRVRAAIPAAVLLTGSAAIVGFVFASVSRTSLLALAAVPLGLALARRVTRGWQRRRAAVAIVAVAAIATGTAIATAALDLGEDVPSQQDSDSDYGYGYD